MGHRSPRESGKRDSLRPLGGYLQDDEWFEQLITARSQQLRLSDSRHRAGSGAMGSGMRTSLGDRRE